MADLFISYSKTDYQLALTLSAFLESRGWSVWWDRNLVAADRYRDEIAEELAKARAVLVLWTKASIASDWVRAEAGSAKAAGKLLPLKTADLGYGDIPLPFGEMHTSDVAAHDLVALAVETQLRRPQSSASARRRDFADLKYQMLTWAGIVGGAITLFSNLTGLVRLAEWSAWLVAHWHELTHGAWRWLFAWIGFSLPRDLSPFLNFMTFFMAIAFGLRRSDARTGHGLQPLKTAIKLIGLYNLALLAAYANLQLSFEYSNLLETRNVKPLAVFGLFSIIALVILFFAPIAITLILLREKLTVFLSVVIPFYLFSAIIVREFLIDSKPVEIGLGEFGYIVIFSFLNSIGISSVLIVARRSLARRLIFVTMGLAALIALNELSRSGLGQMLVRPA